MARGEYGVLVGGFSDDGKRAIAASPDYFLKWYTAKSILLVVALTVVAYQAGTKKRRRS